LKKPCDRGAFPRWKPDLTIERPLSATSM